MNDANTKLPISVSDQGAPKVSQFAVAESNNRNSALIYRLNTRAAVRSRRTEAQKISVVLRCDRAVSNSTHEGEEMVSSWNVESRGVKMISIEENNATDHPPLKMAHSFAAANYDRGSIHDRHQHQVPAPFSYQKRHSTKPDLSYPQSKFTRIRKKPTPTLQPAKDDSCPECERGVAAHDEDETQGSNFNGRGKMFDASYSLFGT